MNEPTRLRERGAGDDAAELLLRARRSRSMTGEERGRAARRLRRFSVVPVAAGLWLWMKGIAVAAGVTLATFAVVRTIDLRSEREAANVTPPSHAPPPALLPSTSKPAIATAPSIEPSASATPSIAPKLSAAEPVTSASAAPEGDSLAKEAALLEQARVEIGSHPRRALELLAEHASSYPRGKLGLERELMAVDALHRLGENAEAKARATALLDRSRGGLYEQRVRKMLAEIP